MKSTTHARKPNLRILALDRRDLPSVTLSSLGVLNIDCGNLNDSVTVSTVGTSVKARIVTTAPGASMGTVFEKLFPAASVKNVWFHGRGGNDRFTNLTDIACRALGDDGNDELIGGSADEWFSGGGGKDTITAGAGKDTVLGSDGDDRIDGGTGDDLLYGGNQADVIWGGAGADRIYGESGYDRLYGGADADKVYGGSGNDTIVTVGGGIDTLAGEAGTDSFWMDTTDVIVDLSATESAQKHVHQVSQFEAYSYNEGLTETAVSKELNGQDLQDPWTTDADIELLYTRADFSAKPLFASGGPTKDDIFQGDTGDCWLMAKLSAIADANPDFIRQMVTDLGDGTYAVRFYRTGVPQYIRVDGDLWVNGAGNPVFAGLGKEGSTWVAIVEKAWAFFRHREGDYESIAGGEPTDAALLGASVSQFSKAEPVSPQVVVNWVAAGSPSSPIGYYVRAAAVNWLNQVKAARAAGKAVTVGAVSGLSNGTVIRIDDAATPANENTYRRGQHVYMVDQVLTNASGTPTGIKLRDPYGSTRTITDMTRIYFCLTNGGAWNL